MGIQVWRELKQSNGQTAVALGCFDGLHLGHKKVIDAVVQVKRDGLIPTVFTFTSDLAEGPCKKGVSFLMDDQRKIYLLQKLGVEQVYLLPFPSVQNFSAQEFVEKVLKETLQAKIVSCGFNFHFGKGGYANQKDLQELCSNLGIQTTVVPKVEKYGEIVSSTKIRKFIELGKIEEASNLLGYCFGFCFPVVHGRELGRKWGTPTINQLFPQNFVLPRFGVYASVVKIEGQYYSGVTNIGVKPTVGSKNVLAETWILDFSGDLYGEQVPVNLLSFIRPEQKFQDLDALKNAIYRDGDTARQIVEKWHLQNEFHMI